MRPSRWSSMPVTLTSRLTSRTPSPPLRSSGIGAADSASSTTSTSRRRSMAAPAATASASAGLVFATTGSGGTSSVGPGDSPRITCPTSRGSITVSASTCRSRPADSSRCTGRSAGVPGAASRVRPIGDPSTSRSRSSRWGRSMPSSSSPIRVASRSVASSVTCPGCQGSPEAASAATRTAVSPHTSALVAKVVDGGGQLVPPRRARRTTRTVWPTERPRSRHATTTARRAPQAGRSRGRRWQP